MTVGVNLMRENENYIRETFVSEVDTATSTANTSADSTKYTVFPFQPTTLKATSRGLIMKFKTRVNLQ